MLASLCAVLSLFLSLSSALEDIIDLDYSRYKGVKRGNGVSSWLGLRYAAAPVANLRFAAPQDPPAEDVVQDATGFRRTCISRNQVVSDQDEDCLFLNVWAPSDADDRSRLPVYVFIPGGGFEGNSGANIDATGLIKAAEYQAVFVNMHYRVGAYGFVAGEELASDDTAALNIGLLDQRKALDWVQKHISSFGGDPDHVFLGGASAGGGSVAYQLLAYGGRDDGLFQAAAGESPSFPGLRTVSENQVIYNRLVNAANCGGASNTLQCLRDLPIADYQKAAQTVPYAQPGTNQPPVYFWGPIVDGDFIEDYNYAQIDRGAFLNVPIIFGSTTNDGDAFTPPAASLPSRDAADAFIKAQWPPLTTTHFEQLHTVFDGGPSGNDWREYASNIYALMRYTCPALSLGRAYLQAGIEDTWIYRWDVGTAQHTAEANSIFALDPPGESEMQVQNHWANMIRGFDPNGGKSGGWQAYGRGFNRDFGPRLLFGNEGAAMEQIDVATRRQCQVIWRISREIGQ